MADDVMATPRAETKTPLAEVILLWPDGAPTTLPDVGPEIIFKAPAAGGAAAETTMLRNVTEPSLAVFRADPAKANGTGVIVCPGGGWRILAWGHEGEDVARWLAARGYAAFLLKYRVTATPADSEAFERSMAALSASLAGPIPAAKAPRSIGELMRDEVLPRGRECAADDGRRALEIVRARAGEWGVRPNRIGMIGFSAGAFLTADVAIDPGGAPLAFAAPIYGGETRGRPVPADAPPIFMVVAQDDRLLFKIVEGLYADWSNADRPAELHVFAKGGHGFGMVPLGLPVDRWTDLFEAWLADQGFA